MRVALYARVSTDRQDKEQTIRSQVDAIQSRAAAEGWLVQMTCADDGYSGATLDRPGLDQVRDAAAAGLIDAVVALCPDRLARNYVHQVAPFAQAVAQPPFLVAACAVEVVVQSGAGAADRLPYQIDTRMSRSGPQLAPRPVSQKALASQAAHSGSSGLRRGTF